MPPKYERLKKWLDESGVQPASPPLAIYHKFDPVKNVAEYTAAIPVATVPANLPEDLHSQTLDEPKTYRVKHVGAYRHLGSAWSAGMMRERAKVFKSAKGHAPFEIYLSDPL